MFGVPGFRSLRKWYLSAPELEPTDTKTLTSELGLAKTRRLL
jgi:hypothetical protein